jgi:hypothetical protein
MEKIRDISIILGILATIVLLIARIYEAGKAEGKRKEEIQNIKDSLNTINLNLTNHIPTLITVKVKELHDRINEVVKMQSDCKTSMGERVSKLEAKNE